MFDKVNVVKAKPTVCKYVVANPKAFLDPANDNIGNEFISYYYSYYYHYHHNYYNFM